MHLLQKLAENAKNGLVAGCVGQSFAAFASFCQKLTLGLHREESSD